MPSSQVFKKWKAGQLHSGSKKGPPVKSHAQAIAIYLSEKRKEGQHGGKYPHKDVGGAQAFTGMPPHPVGIPPHPTSMQPGQGPVPQIPQMPTPPAMTPPPTGNWQTQMQDWRADRPQFAGLGGFGGFGGGGLGQMPTWPTGGQFPQLPQGFQFQQGMPQGGRADGGEVDAAYRQALRQSLAQGKQKYEANLPPPTLSLSIDDIKDAIGPTQPYTVHWTGGGVPQGFPQVPPRADGGNVLSFPGRSALLDKELAQSPEQVAQNRTNRILSQVLGRQNVLPIASDDGKAAGGGLGGAYQFGGSPTSMGLTPGWIERQEARNISHTGPIISAVGGRTDHHNINVPSGSYVLPAAHVSALGQGNTLNGMKILQGMFGPPMKMARGAGPPRMHAPPSLMPKTPGLGLSSSGGSRGDNTGRPVPIMAAGGEFVLSPDQVAKVGKGDIDHGHSILDHWVKNTHKKYAKTVANLPPPAKT